MKTNRKQTENKQKTNRKQTENLFSKIKKFEILKDIKKGLGFSLGIFIFFGIVFGVYAVGFHPANEILSGVFPGFYNFTGDVNFNGNVTGVGKSIVPGWPDVIVCNLTNPNWGKIPLHLHHMPLVGNGKFYYRANQEQGIEYTIVFNPDKSWSYYINIITSNCNIPISTLYANGQAFNTVSN